MKAFDELKEKTKPSSELTFNRRLLGGYVMRQTRHFD
jgi:hypothetical protein